MSNQTQQRRITQTQGGVRPASAKRNSGAGINYPVVNMGTSDEPKSGGSPNKGRNTKAIPVNSLDRGSGQ